MMVSCGSEHSGSTGQGGQGTVKDSIEKVPLAKIPETGTADGDTINIVGKHVLFFHPPAAKAKSLNLSEQDQIRFNTTAQSIIDSIGVYSPGVSASLTELGHVRIYGRKGSPMIISLNTFSEPFGMIISDGTQMAPIIKGLRSREAYIDQIRRVLNFETALAP